VSTDGRPILLCRLQCPDSITESLDGWLPKHFDDSLDHEAVTSVVSYRVHQDFRPDTGLPWVFNGHGNRFIIYVTQSMGQLLAWIGGPVARQAIEDGEQRESQYPMLDGEPFTGNIYEVSSVHKPLNQDFPGPTAILAERFEVGADLEDEFTSWLEADYAPAWAEVADTLRVRTFRQNRGVPQAFPFNRYRSKGNRMIMVEIPLDTDLTAFARRGDVAELLTQSLRWDLRLPYVRRELATNHVIRDKQDAAATYDERQGAPTP